jgi:hypothetical protein
MARSVCGIERPVPNLTGRERAAGTPLEFSPRIAFRFYFVCFGMFCLMSSHPSEHLK